MPPRRKSKARRGGKAVAVEQILKKKNENYLRFTKLLNLMIMKVSPQSHPIKTPKRRRRATEVDIRRFFVPMFKIFNQNIPIPVVDEELIKHRERITAFQKTHPGLLSNVTITEQPAGSIGTMGFSALTVKHKAEAGDILAMETPVHFVQYNDSETPSGRGGGELPFLVTDAIRQLSEVDAPLPPTKRGLKLPHAIDVYPSPSHEQTEQTYPGLLHRISGHISSKYGHLDHKSRIRLTDRTLGFLAVSLRQRPVRLTATEASRGLGECSAGIYRVLCHASHSCSPTAQYVYDATSNKGMLVALTPLKAGDEILISYLHPDTMLCPRSIRWRELRRTRLMEFCSCGRCRGQHVRDEDLEAIRACSPEEINRCAGLRVTDEGETVVCGTMFYDITVAGLKCPVCSTPLPSDLPALQKYEELIADADWLIHPPADTSELHAELQSMVHRHSSFWVKAAFLELDSILYHNDPKTRGKLFGMVQYQQAVLAYEQQRDAWINDTIHIFLNPLFRNMGVCAKASNWLDESLRIRLISWDWFRLTGLISHDLISWTRGCKYTDGRDPCHMVMMPPVSFDKRHDI
eukprot:gnl/Dysnectes_brevis/2574_a3100_794.p1 GENE.gnl/Dysnectes_brevis/2574_a3100_794~~gnl/Dysnectes_brevis/2574_a3100_794.p1  ORF type:complete len:576 (-),score=87.89 gnl/Dysnectes_brevis/2574_a3100_794:100-1827(-)